MEADPDDPRTVMLRFPLRLLDILRPDSHPAARFPLTATETALTDYCEVLG